jgi:hypothetical protein
MQIRHAIYIEEGLEKVIGLLGSEFFLYMKSTRNYIVINNSYTVIQSNVEQILLL